MQFSSKPFLSVLHVDNVPFPKRNCAYSLSLHSVVASWPVRYTVMKTAGNVVLSSN